MAKVKAPVPETEPTRPLDRDAGLCGRTNRPPYAIVDIGSNSVRMVVYDQHGRAPLMTNNAYIESFNGKFRAECLNQHWFLTLDDARQKMEEWRRDYNEVRPHSAIGNKPPISLMNASGASGPP